MDEEKLEGLVTKAVEEELFTLRRTYADKLREVVGPSKISPEEASSLLGVSVSTVYRWLGLPWSRLYTPQADQVPDIALFVGRIASLRQAWIDVLAGWRADMNEDLKTVFFDPKLVSIVESNLTIEEKVRKLVKRTVHALAASEKGSVT